MRDGPDKDWEVFDLEWLEEGQEYVERMLIRWGNRAITRAWSQCADQNPKEIVELRRRARENRIRKEAWVKGREDQRGKLPDR